MAFEQWAPQQLARKGEEAIKTIQLNAEGMIYETWSAPFDAPDEFIVKAKAVLAALAGEAPKAKRIGLTFTALDDKGQILSQCPSSVIGTNA